MSTHAPHPRTGALLVLLSVALATIAAAPTATPALAAECPNEQFRTGYSVALPECRAYELVSPQGIQPHFVTFGTPGQNSELGETVIGAEQGVVAAPSSTTSGIAFFSTFASAGSLTDGPFYLSTRGATGWSTQNVVPAQSTEVSNACLPYIVDWSSDLGRNVLADGYTSSSAAVTCGADEPELVPGEPRMVQNLFVRDDGPSGSVQLVDAPPLVGATKDADFQSASSDLGMVVFDERAQLVQGAPGSSSDDFYVWSAVGGDRLLTVLPDGAPTEGELADATLQPYEATSSGARLTSPTFSHAVAPDGSRAVFVAGGDLYVREHPAEAQSAFDGEGNCDEPTKACTAQVDASQTGEPGGGGEFGGTGGVGAEVVYFSDTHRLTSDSTAAPNEPDLYEYDFGRPVGDRLVDLSVDVDTNEHANVLGFIASNETGTPGEYAYFVATGVLAKNLTAGAAATAGAPNLYVTHEGRTAFVATLDPADSCDWENRCITSRLSGNGEYLGFDSIDELTGIDNRDVATGQPDQNIFLYEAPTAMMVCATCGTSGAPPAGPASIRIPEGLFAFPSAPAYPQRNVSDDGQVFFDTNSALLGDARNGQSNVYEYRSRQLHLLSSGTSEGPSFFYDASTDGQDVYLITAQSLVSGASSAELAVYDAKVGGGFPSTSEPPVACNGEACSGPQTPAAAPPGVSSEAFFGQGNLASLTPKATVKSLSNAQKLAKALKGCRAKRNKHKRVVCESVAHKKYGSAKKKSVKVNRRGK